MSERRIERLCNASLSDLPPFLVHEGGLNSGFMIAHCTAASLVSENKVCAVQGGREEGERCCLSRWGRQVLCHPSSSDSISTSAAKVCAGTVASFPPRSRWRI